jgi:hypothetical protein
LVLPWLWLPLFAVAIACVAGEPLLVKRRLEQSVDPFETLGLRMAYVGGRYVLDEPWSREGVLAHIRPGDQIIAIDGARAPSAPGTTGLYQLAAKVERATGPEVRIRTRSPDGAEQDLPLKREQKARGRGLAAAGVQTAHLVQDAFYGLVPVLTAALLILRRPRDRAVGLMSAGLLLVGMQGSLTGLAWELHVYWPILVLPGSLIFVVLGTLVFPDGRLRPGSAAILAALAVWTVVDLAQIFRITPAMWWSTVSLIVNIGSGLLFASAAGVQITAYRRLPLGRERQQIRWAMFGFGAGAPFLIGSLALNAFNIEDPGLGLWRVVVSDTLGSIAMLLLCAGMAISMLRYRLYDADMVISRSAGYAILTLALAGVWAGAEKTLEVLFEGQFGHEAGAASAGVAAALAALLVTPAHHRVMHWTEQVFQKQLAKLRRDLPEQVGDLRETASVGRLLDAVLERVGDGVRAHRAAVVLRKGKGLKVAAVRGTDRPGAADWLKAAELSGEAMTSDREDPTFPLRLPLVVTAEGREVVGWLLLGPRPDGSFYGKDELDALRDVAEPIARAVHIARLREAREAGLTRELKAIRAELATLRPAAT